MKILGLSNAKTVKGEKLGWLTGICYLAPYTMADRGNVCKDSTPDCRALCLFTAGRGKMPSVWQSRIAKTQLFFDDNQTFMEYLEKDMEAMVRKAERENLRPCVRLNGTSDIPWERLSMFRRDILHDNIMRAYPEVQFYDYTKRFDRMVKYCAGDMPDNYHLTFSLTEDNDDEALVVLRNGANVAYISSGGKKKGARVPNAITVDGDEHDLRFLDPQPDAPNGVLVRLTPKGEAKKNMDQYDMVR